MEQKVVQKAPEQAKKQTPNLTGIPTQMKLDFERRSGLSFDDVRVHYNSDKPAKIDALAYTQGSQVFIGPGHHQHLQHELIHVIQQKTGRVKPGFYFDNIIINESKYLEAEASHNVINRGTISQNLTTNIIQRTKSPSSKTKAQAMRKRPVNAGVKNTGTRSKRARTLFSYNPLTRTLEMGKGRPGFGSHVRKRYPSKKLVTSIDHIVSYHQIQILVNACVNEYLTSTSIGENLFLRIVHLVAPKPKNLLTQILYNEGVSLIQKKVHFWEEVKGKTMEAERTAIEIHDFLKSVKLRKNNAWLTPLDFDCLNPKLFYLVNTLNQSFVNLRLGGARINSAISDSLDPIYKSENMCKLNGTTCVVYANRSLESQFMAQRLHRLFEFVKKLSDFPKILGPYVGNSVASSDLMKVSSSTPYTKLLDFGKSVDYYLIVFHNSGKHHCIVVHIAFFTSKGDLALYQTVKGNMQIGAGYTPQLVLQGAITTKKRPKVGTSVKEVTLSDLYHLITTLNISNNYSANSSASRPRQADISYPLFK